MSFFNSNYLFADYVYYISVDIRLYLHGCTYSVDIYLRGYIYPWMNIISLWIYCINHTKVKIYRYGRLLGECRI